MRKCIIYLKHVLIVRLIFFLFHHGNFVFNKKFLRDFHVRIFKCCIIFREWYEWFCNYNFSVGSTGVNCPQRQVVTMPLLRKEFTRASHRSHTRRVCNCQLFSCSVLYNRISCLDQRSSFTFSFMLSKILPSQLLDIKRFFQRNRLILSRRVSFY